MYFLFLEFLSSGKAAQSENKFSVAKGCYHKAKEAMERLLSTYGASDGLLDNYSLLLVRLSTVELMLGNLTAAIKAVEQSLQCNPTAEVCTIFVYVLAVLEMADKNCKNILSVQQNFYENCVHFHVRTNLVVVWM